MIDPGSGWAIAVADVLRLGFTVVHDPLPDDPAHALVIGENTKQAARALARITTSVIPPRQLDR